MAKVEDLDIESIIAAARITEKTVRLCLRGDLVAEHESAVAALARANARVDDNDDSLTGGARAEAVELAREVQRIESEMEAGMHEFRFRAMPPAEWAALRKKHETADGGLDDDFLPAVVVKCCIAPKMTAKNLKDLRERLSDANDDLLMGTAWAVNRGSVDVPKSLAASGTLARLDSSQS